MANGSSGGTVGNERGAVSQRMLTNVNTMAERFQKSIKVYAYERTPLPFRAGTPKGGHALRGLASSICVQRLA